MQILKSSTLPDVTGVNIDETATVKSTKKSSTYNPDMILILMMDYLAVVKHTKELLYFIV